MKQAVVLGLLLVAQVQCQSEAPVKIREGPKDAGMNPRNSVTFKCKFTGEPQPSVVWHYGKTPTDLKKLTIDPTGTKNFVRDNVAGENTLHVNKVAEDDAGYYQCIANNGKSGDMSSLAHLVVYYFAPHTSAEGQEITVQVGMKLEVPCKPWLDFAPRQSVVFSWINNVGEQAAATVDTSLKRIQEIPVTDETIRDKVAGTLVYLYTIGEDFKGKYLMCGQKNDKLGTTIDANAVEVKKSPGTGTQPLELVYPATPALQKRTIRAGTDFELTAIFAGNPLPTYESWVLPDTVRADQKDLSGPEENKVKLLKASKEHEGIYKLCAKLNTQKKCVEITVELEYPPVFMDAAKPESRIIVVGSNADFKCRSKDLKPTVTSTTWFVNGVQAVDNAKIKVPSGADPSNTLTVLNAQKPGSIMTLQCVAISPAGYTIQSAAVNVYEPFQWKDGEPDQNHTVTAETDAKAYTFSCPYISDSQEVVTTSWYFNVPEGEIPTEKQSVSTMVGVTKSGPGGSVLTVDLSQTPPGKKPRDVYNGFYTCVVVPENKIYAENELRARQQLYFKEDAVTTTVSPTTTELVVSSTVVNFTTGVVAPVAAAGLNLWWIGVIVAGVVLIVLIIIIIVMIHRNRQIAYRVDDEEKKAGHNPERDLADSGFQDFSRPSEEPVKASQGSLNDPVVGQESDEDSLHEYGDIDTGKFNEDGSFIGQYGESKKQRPTDSVV